MKFNHFVAAASVALVLSACATSTQLVSTMPAQPLTKEQSTQPISTKGKQPPEGDFWAHRYSYPTGYFDQRWLQESLAQHYSNAQAVPEGEKIYQRSGASPLALNPNAFTLLGPNPLVGGSGVVAGRINDIVLDPIDPTVAFAASDGGGVWKTTNCCSASTTWTVKTDIPQISSMAIGDLHIVRDSGQLIVYAGTGDLRYGSFSFGSAGLLKSVDGGETWQILGEDVFGPFYEPSAGGFPQYQSIGKVETDPNNVNTVIVGTKTGLYLSYNGGSSWSGPCYTNAHATQRQDTTGLIVVDRGAGTQIYAAIGTRGMATPVQPNLDQNGANGLYRAALPASGCPASWTLLNNGWPAGTGDGAPNVFRGRLEIAMAPSNNNVMYTMISDATLGNGVLSTLRSADGGDTWIQTCAGAACAGGGPCSGVFGTQMWYDAGLTVDPTNPDVVFASGLNVMRSTNGGTQFGRVSCSGVHVDQHARTYVGNDPNKLLVGHDGGINYTENALAAAPSFISLNATLPTIEFYGGDITANFANAAMPGASGGAQDNGSSAVRFSSGPAAIQWTAYNGGDGIFTRIEPIFEQRWYYASQNGAIVASTNGPNAPEITVAPSGWGGDRLSFLQPYELYKYGDTNVPNSGCDNVTGCTRIIAGTHRLWESTSGGIPSSTWAAKTGDLTRNVHTRAFINQLAYSVTDPTIAVTASNDGFVHYVYGLGTASAATAVNVSGNNAVLPNRPIMDVATHPVNPWTAFAVAGGFDQNTPAQPGHVFQISCTLNCASFNVENKSGNLPNIPVNSVIANPNIPNQVFAGTDWGLYFTNDISLPVPVWSRFVGLPHVMIWDMNIDRGFTTLAVFTRSRGAWVWPLPVANIDLLFRDGFEQ